MKGKQNKKYKSKTTLQAWALLAPALIVMLIFTVYPVGRSLYLSFTKYTMGMKVPEWIGLKNYVTFFHTKLFWKVLWNTISFALMTVIPSMFAGIGLALLVNRKKKGVGFLRTSFFYPAIMPMIVIASVWMFIYMAKNGLLDQLVTSLGFKPLNILSNKKTVLPAMAVLYIWSQAGYLMVFFLSGLQNISEEVLEAARLDGATGLMLFRKIMLPLLGPTMLFVSTIALTNSFKFIEPIVIMTEGAPNNGSTMLLYWIYQKGFTNFNYGESSTLTVIMLVLLLVVSLPRFISQDKKIHYN